MWWIYKKIKTNLSLQFKSASDFVSTSVEVLGVDQSGEGKGDSVTEFLLVSQTDLALVVDLSADRSILIQRVNSTNSEFGGVGSTGPWQLNTTVQFVVALLEYWSTEFLTIVAINIIYIKENVFINYLVENLHSCVEDKVFGGVAQGKVVGGDGWFLGIESGLVTGQPSFVANDGGGVNQWTSQINVDIRVNLDIFLSIGNLDLSVFASVKGWYVLFFYCSKVIIS